MLASFEQYQILKHFRITHASDPDIVFRCNLQGCKRSFKKLKVFKNHVCNFHGTGSLIDQEIQQVTEKVRKQGLYIYRKVHNVLTLPFLLFLPYDATSRRVWPLRGPCLLLPEMLSTGNDRWAIQQCMHVLETQNQKP